MFSCFASTLLGYFCKITDILLFEQTFEREITQMNDSSGSATTLISKERKRKGSCKRLSLPFLCIILFFSIAYFTSS